LGMTRAISSASSVVLTHHVYISVGEITGSQRWVVMLSIKNVSLRGFCVALRWARFKRYPSLIAEWTPEQSETVQKVAEEYDVRHSMGLGLVTKACLGED